MKIILGIALAEMVKVAMGNHFFLVGDRIFRQKDGGAISSDLTGEVARIVMLLWDEMFISKLHGLDIKEHFYKRYIDDIIVALKSITNMEYDQVSNKIRNRGDVVPNVDAMPNVDEVPNVDAVPNVGDEMPSVDEDEMLKDAQAFDILCKVADSI